jgi:hypothetical protein
MASTDLRSGPAPARPKHRHVARWVLLGIVVVVLAGGGTFAYLWSRSGAHAVSSSEAIERFRHQDPNGSNSVVGPLPGVYAYRGTGIETISVTPKSQSEGPGMPGTVVRRPGGCFDFRLDFSDHHRQSWDDCVHDAALVSPTRGGYYNWGFVAFHVDDTSTFACQPVVTTVPDPIVPGAASEVACTGSNDNLSTGPVIMRGTPTLVRSGDIRVGSQTLAAVLVSEHVTFSKGQSGSNATSTWFAVSTGLPLRGTWHTRVSTTSPVGISTLDAHGDFALSSATPSR